MNTNGAQAGVCPNPPEGWACTRTPGHEGPCAAIPLVSTTWASPGLNRAYDEVERIRDAMAQPSESGIDETLRRALEAIEDADLEIGRVA